jgi:DNA-directed RNA polymerase subunit E'/Rpb7
LNKIDYNNINIYHDIYINMETMQQQKRGESKIYGVYINSLLTQKIILSITEIGKNIKQNLEQKIVTSNEGRCISHGFIRPGSVKIVSYSSGLINADNVEFQAVFECMICNPVEGMIINCVVKTITKAGIHAEVVTENDIVPVTVFVAKDHHIANTYFNSVKENDDIRVKVIGSRFELNDPYICVIGQLLDPSYQDKRPVQRGGSAEMQKIVLGGDVEMDDMDFAIEN